MAEREPSLGPDAIRAALDRVLASADFDASVRNRNFLRHVVEETLAGRAERIKAYNIATTVFGRDGRFDPQLDSIVRIEAGRLRRSLERYYLTSGRDDPVRIGIPKGSYVPNFDACEAGPAISGAPASRAALGPALVVGPFDEEGDAAAFPGFTRGFVRALVVALTRFTTLRVFDAESMRLPGAERRALPPEPGIDYILTGGMTVGTDHFEVNVLLVEARTGRSIWADSLQRSLQPSEIISARNEVANQVVRTLAQPYGIIYSARARDAEGAPPESLGSYGCVLRFYQYWRTFDRDQLEPVRECLERTIVAEPEYSEAYACLSLVYSNARRFGHPHAGEVDVEGARTIALARQAVALAPGSSWAQYALALAYWFAGDVDRGLEALETGRALNPNDTTIIADLGQRYAMLANWDRALPLLDEAFARNPAQPGTYRIGMFLYHYAHERFEKALAEARAVGAENVVYGWVAMACAAVRLGRAAEAAAAVDAILAIDPRYGERVVEDLRARHLDPGLLVAVVEGLRLAGLPGIDAGAGGGSTGIETDLATDLGTAAAGRAS